MSQQTSIRAITEPSMPLPLENRTTELTKSTRMAAAQARRYPKRTPLARPSRARPPKMAPAPEIGWAPKGSHQSTALVARTGQRRAKTMLSAPAATSRNQAAWRTSRRRVHGPSSASSRGHVSPSGNAPTTVGTDGRSFSGVVASRSRMLGERIGCSTSTRRTLSSDPASTSTREKRRNWTNVRGSPKRALWAITTSVPQPVLA